MKCPIILQIWDKSILTTNQLIKQSTISGGIENVAQGVRYPLPLAATNVSEFLQPTDNIDIFLGFRNFQL